MAQYQIKSTVVIETDTLENASLLCDSITQMFLKEIGARNINATIVSAEDEVHEIIE
jgi:hypothetical protein